MRHTALGSLCAVHWYLFGILLIQDAFYSYLCLGLHLRSLFYTYFICHITVRGQSGHSFFYCPSYKFGKKNVLLKVGDQGLSRFLCEAAAVVCE